MRPLGTALDGRTGGGPPVFSPPPWKGGGRGAIALETPSSDGRTGRRAAPSSLLPPSLLSSPLSGGRSGGGSRAGARVGGGGSSPRPPSRGRREGGAAGQPPSRPPPFQGGGVKAGGRAFAPDAGPGGGISSAIALHANRRPPSRTDSPAPGRGNGRRARAYLHFSPVYPGLSRFIPVYPGLSRFIPVDSGLSRSVPVYSGPSRPVPVAGGRRRIRSAERRVKGAARTAAPCRERRRVRGSPTPFEPRAVDGVHAPVDSICSPPGQPRSSRAPGRPHLEISGRRADAKFPSSSAPV